jgi:cyclic pyranopterin phosphate synthase
MTDRCNLRCLYCLPCEDIPKLRHEDILTYEEILRIAGIAVKLGIEKIRLTGGEPLVRKGFCEILPQLTALRGLKDVALTTNGIYLKENLEKLKIGGLNRLNISLDSLKRKKYAKITGSDGLIQVLEGIEQAGQMGFRPIKINVVVIKGVNDDEVLDFAGLSLKHPYHIRFIEYMPLGIASSDNSLHHVPSSMIKEKLGSIGKLKRVSRTALDGPAERFRFEGAPGEIGFISPLTHHFCHTCNRLRLTASGRLRPCLLSDWEEDLKGPMRKGASDNDLVKIFLKTASNKPLEHMRSPRNTLHFPGQMSSIGG